MLINNWKAQEFYQQYLVLKEEIMVLSLLKLDSNSLELKEKVEKLQFCIKQIENYGGVSAEQLLLLSIGVDTSELYSEKELVMV